MSPRALDLFCRAGGASAGLVAAGFDVTGVDIEPQPEYPFAFVQGDAFTFPLDGYDLIWASPKCQRHSTAAHGGASRESHPDQITPIRARLIAQSAPWIIENVVGAELRSPVLLCGAMFGLGTIRHRIFESSFLIMQPHHPKHAGSNVTGEYVTVTGNAGVPAWTLRERERRGMSRRMPGETSLQRWRDAMGIQWMSRKNLTQAIPPAYSEFLGRTALRVCSEVA